MRACWLKWVGRDWSISADYIWLKKSDANTGPDRGFRSGGPFQGGCSYSFVNWEMLSVRQNRGMLTPSH